MLKPADVQFVDQEPNVGNLSISICDLESQSCEDFNRVLSPVRVKNILQENKIVTPINKRKSTDKTESPPKRCKHGTLQIPSAVQPAREKAYGALSSISSSNSDIHPGGGLWNSGVSARLKNTVVIFDWDDTIFPSSYLAFLDVDYDTAVIPQCLKDRIFVLETHVLELLEYVISLVGESRVCVITNAEKGWITLSGQKFMPRLLQRVYQCRIMSARSTFEPFAPSAGPFEWKLLAFHMAAEVAFGSRFPKPLVYVMKPRQVILPDQRQGLEKTYGVEDNEYFGEDSDSNTEDVDRIQEAFLEHNNDSGSEGTTDTEDNCIVQFSEDCLHQGENEEVTQGVTLTSSAAGNLRNYEVTSVGHDFLKSPSKKIEIIYMPCNEVVGFPDVPADYLKHNGFNFIPAEDIDNVLYAPKFIVSLGDSLAEKIATQNIAAAIPNTVTKTLKYIDRPNLDQLVSQTMLVRSHIQEYLEMKRALDVLINIPDHDMTAFEREFRNQKT